jgi:hypothetical protein
MIIFDIVSTDIYKTESRLSWVTRDDFEMFGRSFDDLWLAIRLISFIEKNTIIGDF